jgi:ABC-type multidrug transport system ATPase subunit
MAPAVHLRAAVALLGRFPALAGVDLDVEAGEVVHLQGPNGAGKTSLLRACAGLLPIAQGEAVVLGHNLRADADRRAVRRHVGLLGHAGFLYDDLSVEDNVRFAVRAAHRPTTSIDVTLERLGLHARLRAVAVGRLSTGQRRRAALAVVVARAPELLLLDEPHAGLDADGRDIVDELMRQASADGIAVIAASHEDLAAHRTLVMAGGQVHATPKEPARVS